ncbi:hypothetical protein HID58_095312 [Brassica napus]|uniref:thioglucosidase n=1 Tax=Brassica napus TaxID=3708 RepID=A0ABQ7X5P3_BRANA|nr:hypothetical protein HID58_095312 [Brassica napus]
MFVTRPIEGASHRALNGWDYFTHRYPEKVPDHSSGDLACDSYDLYKEDVKLLKRMKAQAYRLSIAWSRILPKGRLTGGIDENGIKYYNNLINELKANGIEPYVTIFHWDVPQTLEDEYGGFLSRRIVEDYKNYAELLFQRFGDRVKFWITLNQPYSLASKGYGDGSYPPGRCTGCEFGGDSGTEPYIAPSFVYYPPGFRQILNYIKKQYGNPLTYITENGIGDLDMGNLTLPNALADNGRIQNHCSHISCLKCSIE